MSNKLKSIQLDYSVEEGPHITVQEGMKDQSAMMGASDSSFMHVSTQNGISLSPGRGKTINMQAMPNDVIYGGLIAPQGALTGMIPSTIVTPNPTYRFKPPLDEMMSVIRDVAIISSTFLL